MSNQNTIQYRQVGDYLIPNLILPPEEAVVTLGKWGMMYKSYLEKHKEVFFYSLLILLESLLEGMAEYYSVELAEKVTRGMMENALKCKYNGGALPIGYKVDKEQNFEIDEVTAPAVALAFKNYAEGMSMQHIANLLNYQGIRTHRKTRLDVDSVARMLHNRKYIGEYKFKDVITPGGIPAIVDKELFELVQEK